MSGFTSGIARRFSGGTLREELPANNRFHATGFADA